MHPCIDGACPTLGELVVVANIAAPVSAGVRTDDSDTDAFDCVATDAGPIAGGTCPAARG